MKVLLAVQVVEVKMWNIGYHSLCLDTRIVWGPAPSQPGCEGAGPQTTGDATALGLAKHMATTEFKCLLYFLSDILSVLGSLSVTFQSKDLNLVSMERIINNYKSTLTSLEVTWLSLNQVTLSLLHS